MKILIAAGLATLAMAASSGCSSMHDKSAMSRPMDIDDAAYVARVERTALNRGVSVRWVNPPTKRVPTQL
jgi:hypothetical protein